MSLIILTSVLLRLTAFAWLCWRFWGRHDWRTRLAVAALGLMAARQLVPLCGDLLSATRWSLSFKSRPGDLAALGASVAAFFLALAANLALVDSCDGPGVSAEFGRYRRRLSRSGVWASMLVGGLAMVLSALVGYLAYKDSRRAILATVASRNKALALTLARQVEAGLAASTEVLPTPTSVPNGQPSETTADTSSSVNVGRAQLDDDPNRVGTTAVDGASSSPSRLLERAVQLLRQYWSLTAGDFRRTHLSVIQWPGVVVLSTRHPETVGRHVGTTRLGWMHKRPVTIGQLLRLEGSWSGVTFDWGGEKQISAYVYVPPIRSLVGVHIPASVVEPRIEQLARPWAYCMLLVAGILLPLAFGLIHYSYQSAELAGRATANALLETEGRTRTLLELLPDGVQRCDLTGRITYSNPAHALMHGYQPGELVGRYIWDFKPTESERKELQEYFQRLVREQPPPQPVFGRDLTKDGRIIDIEVNWSYERNRSGDLTGFVAIISDITERRRREEALRESEERFRTLCESAPVGIFLADRDCQWTYVNPISTQLTGRDPEQLLGEGWLEALAPEKRSETAEQWRRACQAGQHYLTETVIVRPDGTRRWLQWWTAPRLDRQGQIVGYVGTLVDVTKRREAEQRLTELANRLQVLSRQLLDAQETERRRIATDLHDQIGQSLTALKVNLQALRRRQSAEADATRWSACLTSLDQVIQQVRNLSRQLRPAVLDDLGLVPALEWLLKSQVNGGLKTRLRTSLGQERLPPHIETAVFRIVQEAATNCLKHAGASQLEVQVRTAGDRVAVAIEDDGCGFDVEQAMKRASSGHSLGLLGMQERVLLLNGQIRIESERGKGTRIHIEIPLVPPTNVGRQDRETG